jgi:RNase adapter protein RapZ
MDIVLITGMSGSGKSVAIHALEDAGFYCTDNLPPELMAQFVELELTHGVSKLAIAIDVRSASSLPQIPKQLEAVKKLGVTVRSWFLDTSTEILVHRFSETRRRHPLSGDDHIEPRRALTDAIELERELLSDLRAHAQVIDTGLLRSAQLQSYVKALIEAPVSQLTLVFESFAFKRGLPLDADYVFDVRMLPNPHYERELRPLTGRDAPVAEFLAAKADVGLMLNQIHNFVSAWLGPMAKDHRSYVTIAIGCTGGQHRSVYLVEKLYEAFSPFWTTLKRHREIDANLPATGFLHI